jgi:hypothetical protein
MDGFEGIIGVGQGGKKGNFLQNPKSAIFGKKDPSKVKKLGGVDPQAQASSQQQNPQAEKKESGPPLSLGIFGSGIQKH